MVFILLVNLVAFSQHSTRKPYDNFMNTLEYGNRVMAESVENQRKMYEYKKIETTRITQQIKLNYESFYKYPENISNGWHSVMMTNNYDNYGERKVYVENNKVTKYINSQGNNIRISYPSIINRAKSQVQLVDQNGKVFDIVELYFLEYLNNQ